jgi:hypothetical protein
MGGGELGAGAVRAEVGGLRPAERELMADRGVWRACAGARGVVTTRAVAGRLGA